jgi:two-component system chemotaxis response regulator CheY
MPAVIGQLRLADYRSDMPARNDIVAGDFPAHGSGEVMSLSAGILIVDNTATSAIAVHTLLVQLGFPDLEMVADGETALERVRERAFVLVISDWRLGAMSGLELLRRIRQNPALKELRFLLVSANPHPQLAGTARTLGADGCLTKPFTADALKGAIAKAIGAGSP